MVVPLPMGVSDPGRRLARIAAQTTREKARSHPCLGTVLRSRIARRALRKILDRQPFTFMAVADRDGPDIAVFAASAQVGLRAPAAATRAGPGRHQPCSGDPWAA